MVAVIGPSGAGKSTLLAAIAGFFAPASGRILCGTGSDLAALAPGARPLSILFQDQNLFPHLTVAQNLGLGLRPDLRLSPAEQAPRSTRRWPASGLAGLGARRPATLSGGQQGRVALARALLRARPADAARRTLRRARPGAQGRDAGPGGRDRRRDRRHGADGQPRPRRCPRALRRRPFWWPRASRHPPRRPPTLLANPPPALARYLGT